MLDMRPAAAIVPHLCFLEVFLVVVPYFYNIEYTRVMSTLFWPIFLALYYEALSEGFSPKLDFSGEAGAAEEPAAGMGAGSGAREVPGAGDVELQHTIVLTTKLKNSRAVHASADDDLKLIRPSTLKQNDRWAKKDDSGEVRVVEGFLALESTQIKSPDTRTTPYPESVFVKYNLNRDGFDVYPENVADPRHWKPSTFYNNINWKSPEPDYLRSFNLPNTYNRHKNVRTSNKSSFHRNLSEDGLKEYYCCKCKEFSERKTTLRARSYPWNYETTTKVKLDGKLAKLD